jgi:tetratricopeptide (TPR) repeat protein
MTRFFVLLTLSLALLASCSKPGSAIVGAWIRHSEFEYGSERTEFFSDGACLIESESERLTGSWLGLDDGRIRVTMTIGGGLSFTMFATVTGDELVLDAGTNKHSAYVRERSQRSAEVKASVNKSVSEREVRIKAEERALAELRAAKAQERERQDEAERVARDQKRESDRIQRERAVEAWRACRAGEVAIGRGLYREGVAEYERAIKLGSPDAPNDLAWHFATCKDATQHDGKRAVELALEATRLKPDSTNSFGTLGAAYARSGQFDEAVKAQLRALSMGINIGGEERLQLYKQQKPYQQK